ncbi:MAG: RlmE family RNA methyltransferase [Bdellovibrionia bacterium]
MAYDPRDYYFLQAKKENYVARSIFKLKEIDERFKVFKPAQKMLDLGAAPGSWSQYASERIGPKGRLLGVDLQAIELTLPNAYFFQGDLRELSLEKLFEQTSISPPFDVVLSDMAPKTTGIRVTDQARSLELCQKAFSCAELFLKPKGTFICKLFHSDEFEGLRKQLRAQFARIEVLRPKSTRKESKEIFFIALQYLGNKKTPPTPQSSQSKES